MRFSDIDTFLTIVETGNFTRASEKLYMSQSTVSHQLKNLEEELGTTLILRQKGQRDITLTKSGENFVPLAQRWLSLWRDMQELQQSERKTTLSIGCTRNLLTCAIPTLFIGLRENSNLNLRILSMKSTEVYAAMERKEIDIGLGFEQPQRGSNVISEPLFCEKMCLIRLQRDTPPPKLIDPHELDAHDEIFFPWFPDYVIWHNACWNLAEGHALEINSSSLLPTLMNDQKLWMIAPVSVAKHFRKTMPLDIIELSSPPPDRTCYKMTSKTPHLSDVPMLEKVNRLIDEFCADLPWEDSVQ